MAERDRSRSLTRPWSLPQSTRWPGGDGGRAARHPRERGPHGVGDELAGGSQLAKLGGWVGLLWTVEPAQPATSELRACPSAFPLPGLGAGRSEARQTLFESCRQKRARTRACLVTTAHKHIVARKRLERGCIHPWPPSACAWSRAPVAQPRVDGAVGASSARWSAANPGRNRRGSVVHHDGGEPEEALRVHLGGLQLRNRVH